MKSAALPARAKPPSATPRAPVGTRLVRGEAFLGVLVLELFFALTKESPRWKPTSSLPWYLRAWRGCRILRVGCAAPVQARRCRRSEYRSEERRVGKEGRDRVG